MEFQHTPVLLKEALAGLNIQPDGFYIDGTVGGAGHALEIARRLTGGKLFAFDRDPDAVKEAKRRLQGYPAEVILDNFSRMKEQMKSRNIKEVQGILLDLGVSSFQLDNPERGFSYQRDGALDMRMSQEGRSAYSIINEAEPEELRRILWEYGEEEYSRQIVAKVLQKRPIQTTGELAEIVRQAVPAKARRKKHPARRTFQALRIAVNQEFTHLKIGLEEGFSLLTTGGRLVVITFHSLEDRIVKQWMNAMAKGCICPPEFPVCVCHRQPKGKRITKKPILPSVEEQEQNPRSRSAKLRIIEKL